MEWIIIITLVSINGERHREVVEAAPPHIQTVEMCERQAMRQASMYAKLPVLIESVKCSPASSHRKSSSDPESFAGEE